MCLPTVSSPTALPEQRGKHGGCLIYNMNRTSGTITLCTVFWMMILLNSSIQYLYDGINKNSWFLIVISIEPVVEHWVGERVEKSLIKDLSCQTVRRVSEKEISD